MVKRAEHIPIGQIKAEGRDNPLGDNTFVNQKRA